jgi:hypothetical protein
MYRCKDVASMLGRKHHLTLTCTVEYIPSERLYSVQAQVSLFLAARGVPRSPVISPHSGRYTAEIHRAPQAAPQVLTTQRIRNSIFASRVKHRG